MSAKCCGCARSSTFLMIARIGVARIALLSDPHFKALNSAGMIPVIDDDGVVVWESNTIVRYLAASRGRTDLLPTQPAARAHVEQWMDWQGSDFNNSWRVAFQGLVRKNPAFQDRDAIEVSLTN